MPMYPGPDVYKRQVELPDMDALDLSQLVADMDLSVSEDALQSLMKKIMNGYKRYICLLYTSQQYLNVAGTCFLFPLLRR